MARRVFLHIGTPKSATTYIQDSLWPNRHELRALGIQVPLAHQGSHWRVGIHARTLGIDGGRTFPVEFKRFLDRVNEWEGDIVLSTEILCAINPKQVKLFVESIPCDEVHVIITARDFVRQVTAEWQQHVKGGVSRSLEEFIADIRKRDSSLWFWKVQDLDAITRRWASVIPVERIHLVTVPKTSADPELVWKRFCGVLGVDPARVPPRNGQSNVSLGFPQTESLRLLNRWRIENGMAPGDAESKLYRSVKFFAPLRESKGPKIQIPVEDQEWAKSIGEEMVGNIQSRGVNIVGSVEDLDSFVLPASANTPLSLDGFVEIITPILHDSLLRLERANEKNRTWKTELDLTREKMELKIDNHVVEIARQKEVISGLRDELERRSTIRGGLSTIKGGIKRRLKGLFRRSAA